MFLSYCCEVPIHALMPIDLRHQSLPCWSYPLPSSDEEGACQRQAEGEITCPSNYAGSLVLRQGVLSLSHRCAMPAPFSSRVLLAARDQPVRILRIPAPRCRNPAQQGLRCVPSGGARERRRPCLILRWSQRTAQPLLYSQMDIENESAAHRLMAICIPVPLLNLILKICFFFRIFYLIFML